MKKIFAIAMLATILTGCASPTTAYTTNKSPDIGKTLPFSGHEVTKYIVKNPNRTEIEMFDWCEADEISIPDMLEHIEAIEKTNTTNKTVYSFALTTNPVYSTDEYGKAQIIEDIYVIRILETSESNYNNTHFASNAFDTAFAAQYDGKHWTYAGIVYPTREDSTDFYYYSVNYPYVYKSAS